MAVYLEFAVLFCDLIERLVFGDDVGEDFCKVVPQRFRLAGYGHCLLDSALVVLDVDSEGQDLVLILWFLDVPDFFIELLDEVGDIRLYE